VSTILVVDDEPDIRTFVRLTLGADDHEVVEATNGREALEAVGRRRPDLIVLDVVMPEVSGWDTLAALKADRDDRVREIPVVVLTALSTPLDRAKGGIEGAVRYLVKPVPPEDLRTTIASALDGGPEPEQRRHALRRALEDLARLERGGDADDAVATGPRLRLSGLESVRTIERAPAPTPDLRAATDRLTTKQVALLRAVRRHPTVLAAAADLELSRSNVYASLRRIARRLGVRSVTELLDHVRAGRVVD
jgi:CheY-like chemotaxis protein/DNA-binding CsgD family transcriptional regulator